MKLKTELNRMVSGTPEAYKRGIERVIYHEIEDMFKCGLQFFHKIYEVSCTNEELAYAAMVYASFDDEYNDHVNDLIHEYYWKECSYLYTLLNKK